MFGQTLLDMCIFTMGAPGASFVLLEHAHDRSSTVMNIVSSEHYITLKQIRSAKHLFTTARAKEFQVARMLSPKQSLSEQKLLSVTGKSTHGEYGSSNQW